MLARDPFRHVGPYGEPANRGPIPIGDGWHVLRCVLLSAGILAGLLLAVGAIGR